MKNGSRVIKEKKKQGQSQLLRAYWGTEVMSWNKKSDSVDVSF